MLALMQEFGVVSTHGPGRTLAVLDARASRNAHAPYDMVRRMRASILVLAPLLNSVWCCSAFPCLEAARLVRGLSIFTSKRSQRSGPTSSDSGYIHAQTRGDRLQGGRIVLSSPSVGATETALMAATLARGETEILNAAREPEVCDLALCLSAMGARIKSAGSRTGSLWRGWKPSTKGSPPSDHRPHRGWHLRRRGRDHRRST